MPKRQTRLGMPRATINGDYPIGMPQPPLGTDAHKTIPSPRRRRGVRRITAAERVKNGSPRTALSPLRMSMDHSSSIKYKNGNHAYDSYSPRKKNDNPMEILKILRDHMTQREGASADVVKVFNDMDVGGKDGGQYIVGAGNIRKKTLNGTPIKMDDGFGDKKLGSNEIKTGLNFLLSTNINDVDAKNILNIMDRDGDGEIDIREFLDAAQGDRMEKKIREYEWRKKRHLIKPEKRILIESRRPFAKKTKARTKDFNGKETSHQKFLRKCYESKTNRDAFYRPENVLEQLRDRVKMDHIVSTFRNMDNGADDGHGEYAHAGHENELQDPFKTKAKAFNSQLEPKELALGINQNLNMDLNVDEINQVLKIVDEDHDGHIDFPEFLKALRGPEVQQYIDDKKRQLPNHNVTKNMLLKAKKMAPKVGSNAWKEAGAMYPRRGKNSMIAEMAIQDMNPNNKDHHGAELGWSGHQILVPQGRGHVNWTGKNKRGGPLLGPRVHPSSSSTNPSNSSPYRSGRAVAAIRKNSRALSPRSSRSSRSPRSRRSSYSNSNDSRQKVTIDETSGEWCDTRDIDTAELQDVRKHSILSTSCNMEERNSQDSTHVDGKTQPHQGGSAYKSQLYGVFDNNSTIQQRMQEIQNIGNYHAEVRRKRDDARYEVEIRNEYIAQKKRHDRFHPPPVDNRSYERKIGDDLMAHYTARRYRNPSRLIG